MRNRGMTWIEGGEFSMGSDRFYPEERPLQRVSVDGFWIDRQPVTVREFRRFVAETGYVTVAERPVDPDDYPDADPQLLVSGSLVFHKTPGPVSLSDYRVWWRYVPGACWTMPEGPGSGTGPRARHPVVHVAHEDAAAYASWAGKSLPTEAEWEFAARGGLDGAVFCWGDDPTPGGRLMANTWQGRFPWENLKANGYEGTSPVSTFPPNGYGLFDMAGNVWEWTEDFFTPEHRLGAVPERGEDPAGDSAGQPAGEPGGSCCAPHNPRVSSPHASYEHGAPGAHIPRRVIKGGSHLCAPSYCLRFRPAARQGEAIDTSTSHIGFRCVTRDPGPVTG